MTPRDPRLNPYQLQNNKNRVREAIFNNTIIEERKAFKPGLSIVILNLNKPELICPLLEQLVQAQQHLAADQIKIEILVGDTGSSDQDVLQCYEKLSKHLTVVRDLKYHFSKNNSEIFFRHVTLDQCLFMNNDIVFLQGSCSSILRRIYQRLSQNSKIGILGASLLYEDERIQHLGIDFFRDEKLRGLCYHPMHQAHFTDLSKLDGSYWTVPAVTGAFLAIRSSLFQSVRGFDGHYDTECQDVDLCLRSLRSGMTNELLLTDKIIHLENATRPKGSEHWGDRQRFVRRWTSFVEAML